MNIGIYIYDGAEVLDFSGPFEVFSTAKRLAGKDWNISLVAQSWQPIAARGGFQVIPHQDFSNHEQYDLLLISGGEHHAQLENQQVLHWLKMQAERVTYLASVCTGGFLLAEAGLLDGLQVTTHWEDLADLESRYPALDVIANQRWVEQGNVLTSGGISAGIDMSLGLVGKLASWPLAQQTAKQMEYVWSKNR
ncbi:DJ-1/PfpI family protein [Vibrio sp. TRT 21S02]|uniref:DJ-1/PfpI family protein n=1 Tax=Vibrio sp. TRT 21S02 TaxID=3418507 RepID=UPI003CF42FE5